MNPRSRMTILATLILLLVLGVGLVIVAEALLPWVDVRAHLEGEDVVFDVTHFGILGIDGFSVEDSSGRTLWKVYLHADKGDRITYGILPSGGNMPARQIFPPGERPEGIRGRRVTVWIECRYMETAPTRCEFRKELDIP